MNKQLIKIVLGRTLLALLVAYILLNLGRAVQTNVETNTQITDLNEQIADLKNNIHHLENSLVYFQSDAYRLLEAKRRLGLKRPGETVVLVSSNDDPPEDESAAASQPDQLMEEPVEDLNFFEQASVNAEDWIDWLLRRQP